MRRTALKERRQRQLDRLPGPDRGIQAWRRGGQTDGLQSRRDADRDLQAKVAKSATVGKDMTTNSAAYTCQAGDGGKDCRTNEVSFEVQRAMSVVANGSTSSSANGSNEPLTVSEATAGSRWTDVVWNTGNDTETYQLTLSKDTSRRHDLHAVPGRRLHAAGPGRDAADSRPAPPASARRRWSRTPRPTLRLPHRRPGPAAHERIRRRSVPGQLHRGIDVRSVADR